MPEGPRNKYDEFVIIGLFIIITIKAENKVILPQNIITETLYIRSSYVSIQHGEQSRLHI